MPTTEQISTPEMSGTHVISAVVDSVKYDSCTLEMTETNQRHEDHLACANSSLRRAAENQSETEDSLSKNRPSRAAVPDFTTVRIPT